MTEVKNISLENEALSPKEIAFMGYLRACNDLKTRDGSLEKKGREYNAILERCNAMDKVSTNIIQMIFGKLDAGDVSTLNPNKEGSKISGLKQNYFNEDKFAEIIRLANIAINQSDMEYPGTPAYTLTGIENLQKVFTDFKSIWGAYLNTLEAAKKDEEIASVKGSIDKHDREIARLQEEIAFHEELKAKRLEEMSKIIGETQEEVSDVMEVSREKDRYSEGFQGTEKEAQVSTVHPEASAKQLDT